MKSRRTAMSLIELTLVILVLGIMAAFAAPRFTNAVQATRLRSTAYQIAAHLDHVRRTAIHTGRDATWWCDSDSDRYGSDQADFPDRVGQPLLVAIRELYDPTFSITADFDSQSQVTFDLEGVPRVADQPLVNGVILLTAGNQGFVISVAAGTGVTTVQSWIPQVTR